MPLIQFVHNPESGSFSARRYQALMDAALALGHHVVSRVSSQAHPFKLETGAAHICAVGGDGTIRHVAASLARETNPPTLSIYPMGTINLVARELNWPTKPCDFVRDIDVANQSARMWPVMINQDCFIACASIGPDARAVATVSNAVKAKVGRLAYGVALIQTFFAWRRPCLTVNAEGEVFECEAIYIAKGRYYAGPWSFAPAAQLDQPMLHVVALPSATRLAYVRFLVALLLGRIEKMIGLRRMTVRSLSIECTTPQPVQIDGDTGGMTPVQITLADRPLC